MNLHNFPRNQPRVLRWLELYFGTNYEWRIFEGWCEVRQKNTDEAWEPHRELDHAISRAEEMGWTVRVNHEQVFVGP